MTATDSPLTAGRLDARGPLRGALRTIGWPLATIGAALALFVLIALVDGSSIAGLVDAVRLGILGNPNYGWQVLVRAVPIVLAALAVAIPARAGYVNVGGEGQLIIGAVAATGIGVAIGSSLPGPLGWILCIAAGALAAGAWAAIGAALRVWFKAPEAVTTLLMNFIALDIMLYLLYQPWKDPAGSGQPQSRPIDDSVMLPQIGGTPISIAILLVALQVAVVWFLVARTSWGFKLSILGGNPEVASRSGLSTSRLAIQAMALGGALAGAGGALTLLGVEGMLRPDITTTLGFVAFLAAFVAGNRIVWSAVVAVVFAAVLVASNALQLRAGLDGTATFVLLGLLCLGLTIARSTVRRTS